MEAEDEDSVVLVKTYCWGCDGVSSQEPGRTARIFGCNHVNLTEDANRAKCDVLQIADRRRYDEESARHVPAQACLERVVIVPSGDVRSRTVEAGRQP